MPQRRSDALWCDLSEHKVTTLVMRRMVGVALSCEDVIDHEELRHDPVLAGKGQPYRRCNGLSCRAHLLVPMRNRALDGTVRPLFERWRYPDWPTSTRPVLDK
jgi:hypothetical protein